MRILIIKTSALGDVIHALPVLDYLRQVAPEARIEWVVEEQFLPLLVHNPLIEQIHVIRTKAWRRQPFASQTWRELALFRRKLRATRFDLVFDLQGNLKSGLVAWLGRSAERFGFETGLLQEKLNALFTNRKVGFRPEDNRTATRYLRVVSVPFGRDYLDMDISSEIVSAIEDEETAARYLASLPRGIKILLQIGTTWDTKLWYPEGWIELARRILDRYHGATLLINWGSPVEKALGERIVNETGSSVHLLPWFRIQELIPLIRQVQLVVGGDTGPVYIAGAVGTPTVSLYRATSAALYAPVGPCHYSIQAAMPCTGCMKSVCDRDQECRYSISADSVMDAVNAILNEERCLDHA